MAQNQSENQISEFEKGVLEYIRKSNVGSQKAGYGPLSIRSQQTGNDDLAQALMAVKQISANDGFDRLDKLGKSLLDKISDLAEESIMADASRQKHSLEQIRVLKELLPLVEEGTEEQKKSKQDLISFIGKTEKGMLKNASFKNRLIEFTKAMLPSMSGIVSAIASKSPLVGAAMNFGLEKLQEREENRDNLKKDAVKSLIGALEYAKKNTDEPREEPLEQPEKPTTVKTGSDAIPVYVVDGPGAGTASESRAEQRAKEQHEGLQEFYDGMEENFRASGVEGELLEEVMRRTKATVDDFTGGLEEKIDEFLVLAFEESEAIGGILNEAMKDILSKEEDKREEKFQMEEQNALLERVADAIELQSTDEGKRGDGESDGSFKDKILGWLGLGAAGTTVLTHATALLAKFKGIFKMVLSVAAKIPGVSLVAKGLGKIFSFPVQFVAAMVNALKEGTASVMKGEGIALVMEKSLYGFANWFTAGFLKHIQTWFSGSKITQAFARPFFKLAATVENFFDSTIFHVKKIFSDVTGFIRSPLEGIKSLGRKMADYWTGMIDEVMAFASDPKTFIRGKLDQLREGVRKFFFSMVPEWIPLKFIPENMREDVKKYRYGGGSSSDVEANMARNPSVGDALVTPPTRVNTKPAADPIILKDLAFEEDEDYDPLASMSERLRGATSKASAVRSTSADDFIGKLLVREGGFVNDPTDRGGATNMGITKDTLSEHLGRNASVEDVKGLDKETARKIYEEKFLKPFEDVKDERIKEFLFDTGVHSGVGKAKEFYSDVKEGGVTDEQDMLEKLIKRRKEFFAAIIERDPSQKRFEKGWNNRLAEFETKAKEGRAEAMYSVNQQIAKSEKSQSNKPNQSVTSLTSKTTNNTNQTHVSRKSPTNQDPSARFYSPNLATA